MTVANEVPGVAAGVTSRESDQDHPQSNDLDILTLQLRRRADAEHRLPPLKTPRSLRRVARAHHLQVDPPQRATRRRGETTKPIEQFLPEDNRDTTTSGVVNPSHDTETGRYLAYGSYFPQHAEMSRQRWAAGDAA